MMRCFLFALASVVSLSLFAADPAPDATPTTLPPDAPPAVPASSNAPNGTAQKWIDVTPTPHGPMLIQLAPPPPYRDYQMSRILPPEERRRWLQMAMPVMANMMQMDAREAMNHFTVKYKVKPGVSFDEVVQSMMLRANQMNLKFVGSNLIGKDFKRVLNDDTAPRIEVFSFCDIALGRTLLRIIPEMAVFIPCRITVMEDADKNIWVMTLDWDVTWLEMAGQHGGITPELRQGAAEIRDKMDRVMRAAANGEL